LKPDFEIVVVGTSAGGLKALQTMLGALSPVFPLPIVVVQHRSKDSDGQLCEYLAGDVSLPVSEPEDKEEIMPGRVYLAPRDYHLLIETRSFALSTARPLGFARPSIDVLFESAADQFRERTIGVILTGANRDGARGLAAIKSRGGFAIVEDPSSAASREMPEAAITFTKPDLVLPLNEIAHELFKLSESVNPRTLGPVGNRVTSAL
jgi:two-component system, chemotaxis family, protein-glutamate methylesterase/glutaminase